MKYLIIILAFLAVGSILTGLIVNFEYSQKMIGGGVAGLFFVVFPLFIYYRWKDKNFKDYMLTNESLEEMKKHNKDL